MRGGLRPLVHPATKVNEIEIEASRPWREAERRRLLARQQLAERFACCERGERPQLPDTIEVD